MKSGKSIAASKSAHEVSDRPIASEQSLVAKAAEQEVEKKLKQGKTIKSSGTADQDPQTAVKEVNGPKGLEPARYGDWESKGRCHDF